MRYIPLPKGVLLSQAALSVNFRATFDDSLVLDIKNDNCPQIDFAQKKELTSIEFEGLKSIRVLVYYKSRLIKRETMEANKWFFEGDFRYASYSPTRLSLPESCGFLTPNSSFDCSRFEDVRSFQEIGCTYEISNLLTDRALVIIRFDVKNLKKEGYQLRDLGIDDSEYQDMALKVVEEDEDETFLSISDICDESVI